MKDHPIVGMIPPLAFLVILVSFQHLIRDPYARYLPWAAGFCALVGAILVRHVNQRLHDTSQRHDLNRDTEAVYHNPNVPVDQKFMLMQQRMGCFTAMASIGWFLLGVVFVGLWLLAKYGVKQ